MILTDMDTNRLQHDNETQLPYVWIVTDQHEEQAFFDTLDAHREYNRIKEFYINNNNFSVLLSRDYSAKSSITFFRHKGCSEVQELRLTRITIN